MPETGRATVRVAARPAWETACETLDDATFFHSPAWADVWRAHTGGRIRPDALELGLRDGRKVLVPVSEERQLGGTARRGHLSPGGTYGGPLSESPLAEADYADILEILRRRYGGITWRGAPGEPVTAWLARLAGTDAEETHVVDLRESPEDRARRWSKGHKAAARRAEREGVRVRLASSAGDWDAYYQLYQGRLRHWGAAATSSYPRSFFSLLAEKPGVKLWLAAHDERIIAGALCLYGRRHVAYWHGAADDEFSSLQPAHLTLRTAMDDAAVEGRWWFDYLPSGQNAGVAAFKHGFGAHPLPAPIYRRDGLVSRLHRLVSG